jgi:hypothetical protein
MTSLNASAAVLGFALLAGIATAQSKWAGLGPDGKLVYSRLSTGSRFLVRGIQGRRSGDSYRAGEGEANCRALSFPIPCRFIPALSLCSSVGCLDWDTSTGC